MRRKVNDSEIHEIKRYYEVPSEKVQEWTETIENLTKQRDQYKQAYQHCVDDLIVLRANNKRLERENGGLRTKLENAETYIDAIKTYYPMYENLSNRYNALTNHIRTKAECNPGIWRYIDLVKYIDRLERADDER